MTHDDTRTVVCPQCASNQPTSAQLCAVCGYALFLGTPTRPADPAAWPRRPEKPAGGDDLSPVSSGDDARTRPDAGPVGDAPPPRQAQESTATVGVSTRTPVPGATAHDPLLDAPTDEHPAPTLLCASCGEDNPVKRTYCQRCGSTLRPSVVVQRTPPPRPWPTLPPRTALVIGALAAVVVVPLLLAQPWADDDPDGTPSLNASARLVPVDTARVQASGPSIRSRPARFTVDGKSQPAWQFTFQEAEPPVLTFTFDEPVQLAKIDVLNGDQARYRENLRVRRAVVVLERADGTQESQDWELADKPRAQRQEAQSLLIAPGAPVVGLDLEVKSVYRKGTGFKEVALAEVTFVEAVGPVVTEE